MLSLFSKKKNSREDGEATRRHILETAVRLFAEHGYADTTSKMICREAGVNMASVNYHFGSRDDLYRAVLDDVHDQIVNMAKMVRITSADTTAEEKLSRVLEAYLEAVYNGEGWHMRIWAHELTSPSPMGGLAFLEGTFPKEESILTLLSEVTGIPYDAPELQCCLVSVMSPYLLMLCVQRDLARSLSSIFDYDRKDVDWHLKEVLIPGIRAYAEKYAGGKLPAFAPPQVREDQSGTEKEV